MDLVCYHGHHKSGTTWVTDVLRDVVAERNVNLVVAPDPNLFRAVGMAAWARENDAQLVCFTNAVYDDVPDEMRRGFHVIRDPRDILVSAYYSHLKSHPLHPLFPQLGEIRARLNSVSKDEGLSLEIRILEQVFHAMASWRYDDPRHLELRFEDLADDAEAGFTRALEFLGWMDGEAAVSPARLAEIVASHSFSAKADGRARGETDDTSHYRKGIAGDWRNELTDIHLEQFEAAQPGLIKKLGYDPSQQLMAGS